MSCSEAGAGKGDREERGEGCGDDSGVMDWGPPNSKASRKSCQSTLPLPEHASGRNPNHME